MAATGGIIEPTAARLVVEGNNDQRVVGRKLELTRVETSNTYVVVLPMRMTGHGKSASESSKRRKLSSNGGVGIVGNGKHSVVLLPRSLGLGSGHFARALRKALG